MPAQSDPTFLRVPRLPPTLPRKARGCWAFSSDRILAPDGIETIERENVNGEPLVVAAFIDDRAHNRIGAAAASQLRSAPRPDEDDQVGVAGDLVLPGRTTTRELALDVQPNP